MATETKKGPKRDQNAKTPKMQKLKIDPCLSPTPHLPKKCKKKHIMQRKAGLSKNQPKKHKNAIFAKPPHCPILKFWEVILLI